MFWICLIYLVCDFRQSLYFFRIFENIFNQRHRDKLYLLLQFRDYKQKQNFTNKKVSWIHWNINHISSSILTERTLKFKVRHFFKKIHIHLTQIISFIFIKFMLKSDVEGLFYFIKLGKRHEEWSHRFVIILDPMS